MRPFPKWVGVLGWISSIAPAAYVAYETGGLKGLLLFILMGGGTSAAVTAHSLTGTGGTPRNP